jgi:hypothetical protein
VTVLNRACVAIFGGASPVTAAGSGALLCSEGADLDQVVGEYAMSVPGLGTRDAGEFGAVPAVASFEVADSSFGSGSPFDLVAEGV